MGLYRFVTTIITLLGIFTLCGSHTVLAKDAWVNSPLSPEAQIQLQKAGKYMKAGKYDKAGPYLNSALTSADDLRKCLAIADYTDRYGFHLMEVRRACIGKALSLCATKEDYILVALKARQFQFYEITKQAIAALLKGAKTLPELYELAYKSHEVSLTDVAHMCLEKAYAGIHDFDDAMNFIKNARAVGMEDLVRKASKDLIDDENDPNELCALAAKLESYGMRDQLRYLLKKALDKARNVPEMERVAETARQYNEPDIKERAAYFAKKGRILDKLRAEQSGYEASPDTTNAPSVRQDTYGGQF